MKKRGLGKGLDAIFAENTDETTEGAVSVKISEIEPNRDQPRKEFDSEALSELADSISQHDGGLPHCGGRTPLAGRPHGRPHRSARHYPGDERRGRNALRPH